MDKTHIVSADTWPEAEAYAARVAALMPKGDTVYPTVSYPAYTPNAAYYMCGDRCREHPRWKTWHDGMLAKGALVFDQHMIELAEKLREDDDDAS